MAVVLTILKVIGIVLLAILALVLLLLLIALFVPIRYRLCADKTGDEIGANVAVSFLLHAVSFKARYENKGIPYKFKIFGIPLKRGDFLGNDNTDDAQSDNKKSRSIKVKKIKAGKVKNKKRKSETANVNCQANEVRVANTQTGSDGSEEYKRADRGKVISEAVSSSKSQAVISKEATEGKPDKPVKHSLFRRIAVFIQSIRDKIKAIYEGIVAFVTNIGNRIEKINSEYAFYEKFINDERNKEALKAALEECKRVIKLIWPRRMKGEIHFGFEDPATTGQILVFLSILYSVLPRKLHICPEFDKEVLEGNIMIRGRIILAVLLIAFVRVYFNKNIKRFIRIYKKHKNKSVEKNEAKQQEDREDL